MSYKLMHDVLHCEAVGGTDKYVLMAIADFMNETTLKCSPSYDTLAKVTGLGRATVARSIAALKNAKLLISGKRGFWKSNNYLIVLPESPKQSQKMRLQQSQNETVANNTTSNINKEKTPSIVSPISKNGAASPISKPDGNETSSSKDNNRGNIRSASEAVSHPYTTESVKDFKLWLEGTPIRDEVARIVNDLHCGQENRVSNMRLFFALIKKLEEKRLHGNPYNLVLRILREDGMELAETNTYEFNEWVRDFGERLRYARRLDCDEDDPGEPSEDFAHVIWNSGREPFRAYCIRNGLPFTKDTAKSLQPSYRKVRDEFVRIAKESDESIYDLLFDVLGRAAA